jgi:hypothetical protein
LEAEMEGTETTEVAAVVTAKTAAMIETMMAATAKMAAAVMAVAVMTMMVAVTETAAADGKDGKGSGRQHIMLVCK